MSNGSTRGSESGGRSRLNQITGIPGFIDRWIPVVPTPTEFPFLVPYDAALKRGILRDANGQLRETRDILQQLQEEIRLDEEIPDTATTERRGPNGATDLQNVLDVERELREILRRMKSVETAQKKVEEKQKELQKIDEEITALQDQLNTEQQAVQARNSRLSQLQTQTGGLQQLVSNIQQVEGDLRTAENDLERMQELEIRLQDRIQQVEDQIVQLQNPPIAGTNNAVQIQQLQNTLHTAENRLRQITGQISSTRRRSRRLRDQLQTLQTTRANTTTSTPSADTVSTLESERDTHEEKAQDASQKIARKQTERGRVDNELQQAQQELQTLTPNAIQQDYQTQAGDWQNLAINTLGGNNSVWAGFQRKGDKNTLGSMVQEIQNAPMFPNTPAEREEFISEMQKFCDSVKTVRERMQSAHSGDNGSSEISSSRSFPRPDNWNQALEDMIWNRQTLTGQPKNVQEYAMGRRYQEIATRYANIFREKLNEWEFWKNEGLIQGADTVQQKALALRKRFDDAIKNPEGSNAIVVSNLTGLANDMQELVELMQSQISHVRRLDRQVLVSNNIQRNRGTVRERLHRMFVGQTEYSQENISRIGATIGAVRQNAGWILDRRWLRYATIAGAAGYASWNALPDNMPNPFDNGSNTPPAATAPELPEGATINEDTGIIELPDAEWK